MAQYVIKPSDVYTSKPEIPEGWRFVAFRPPKTAEWYVPVQDYLGCACTPLQATKDFTENCRVIVERIPAPAAPKITHLPAFYVSITDVYGINNPKIPRGWRIVAFRYPKHGEYFLSTVHEARVRQADWTNGGEGSKALPRLILEPIPTPNETTADDWWE